MSEHKPDLVDREKLVEVITELVRKHMKSGRVWTCKEYGDNIADALLPLLAGDEHPLYKNLYEAKEEQYKELTADSVAAHTIATGGHNAR